MKADFQKALDKELARHETVIGVLAQARLRDFVTKEWDDTPLELTFGMGSCYIEVNGEQVMDDDYPEIEAVLRDVEDITDNYRRACPSNIKV